VRRAVSHTLTGYDQSSISCVPFDSCIPAPLGVWSSHVNHHPYFHILLHPSIAISHKIQYSNRMLTCDFTVANPEHIHRAHTHLYSTVFDHRRAFSSSPASAPARARAPAINGDTLAVVNNAASASSATTQQHGLLGQRPLPDGPFFGTLPIREQSLAVASLEASLPVVSAATPVSAPEQEAREHGVLLLLGDQEKEVVDEVQDEEDGDVEL
jgi:hypothetical protein